MEAQEAAPLARESDACRRLLAGQRSESAVIL
jgi:hypothetical protein